MVDRLAMSYGYPDGYVNPYGNQYLGRVYDAAMHTNTDIVVELSDRPALLVFNTSGNSEIDLEDTDAIDELIRCILEESDRRDRS